MPRKGDGVGLLQYAALPYRLEGRDPMVMLVTSRETKRWILPKGQPEKKLSPARVAEQEAFEEAGLVGRAHRTPHASFPSIKRLKNGKEVRCRVIVYLLAVSSQVDTWPEQKQRERRWMTPGEAALLTGEPGLVSILIDFSGYFDESAHF